MTLAVVILAAGEGTRMKSRKPKVLHDLGGRPLLAHVISAARALCPEQIVIVHGNGADAVRAAFPESDLEFVLQDQRLGTGHALMQAMPALAGFDDLLVLYGDVPLTQPSTLKSLIENAQSIGLAVLSMMLENPTGYGRIVRDEHNRFSRIVEEKDASAAQRAIKEVNSGIVAGRVDSFRRWLDQIRPNNANAEYYLTDCVALAVADGLAVRAEVCADADETLGINDRVQLAQAERIFQRRQAESLMRLGVTIRDPARIDIRGEITSAADVEIDVNTVFLGRVVLGEGVYIGPNCVVRDAEIGAGTRVLANSVIKSARIGERCRIGPFARIRPETVLANHVHIGNFVEIKKSNIAARTKINHLSYIGDSEVGTNVNIGAGTITCNYDGANKHKTIIGNDVFIGSDTQLVAPVTLGDGATVGAGSTITKDAPAGTLTVSRAPQRSTSEWSRPKKEPDGENK